jgi:hypothetical protein
LAAPVAAAARLQALVVYALRVLYVHLFCVAVSVGGRWLCACGYEWVLYEEDDVGSKSLYRSKGHATERDARKKIRYGEKSERNEPPVQ